MEGKESLLFYHSSRRTKVWFTCIKSPQIKSLFFLVWKNGYRNNASILGGLLQILHICQFLSYKLYVNFNLQFKLFSKGPFTRSLFRRQWLERAMLLLFANAANHSLPTGIGGESSHVRFLLLVTNVTHAFSAVPFAVVGGVCFSLVQQKSVLKLSKQYRTVLDFGIQIYL